MPHLGIYSLYYSSVAPGEFYRRSSIEVHEKCHSLLRYW